jgi:spore coat polysaccharide biosynthesis protein SpsF (cytidylyltransferase family)
MRLEGKVLVLMQNLRCITRQIELLRVVGAPV